MTQIILSWASTSWKTTAQDYLTNTCKDLSYNRPPNFTTRKPRSDAEVEYVFLDKDEFNKKMTNWEFITTMDFNDNKYAYWKFDPEVNYVFSAIPEIREQLESYFTENNIEYKSIYIDLDPNVQANRLEQRVVNKEITREDITKRKDVNNFFPGPNCSLVSGNWNLIDMLWQIKKIITN